jgi:DNA helicase-2/ATP-dependent DNA helicase PcrA
VLAYTDGKMGVSAVPGSGKTHVLSFLAAQLVSQGLDDDQEVLVVTFANSSVDNFNQRITAFIRQEYALLPHVGYRVRTLHGLAHDIVRERPSLAGLAEDFSILDERVTNQMREDAALLWLRQHPFALESFIARDVDERGLRRIQQKHWPELVFSIADRFIGRAKDLQLSPAALRIRLSAELAEEDLARFPLLQMGLNIYEDYQRALTYRGGVDFDDLIRLALEVIQADPQYLARLRYRWPFVLEDEAQDSSYLQEQILRRLTRGGNWVRVGDPNQAINTTFTTANPYFLRQFLVEEGVVQHTLPNSGRSIQRIVDLANFLIDWTCTDHPTPWLRRGESAAFLPQHIQPTPPDDPQPNPEDDPDYVVHLESRNYDPDRELRTVVRSLERWLPDHRDWTVAVLVPINARGFKLAELLRARNLPCEELLRSTAGTRQTAGILEAVLRYLANPLRPDFLAEAFNAWDEAQRPEATEERPKADEKGVERRRARLAKMLRRCRHVERYVYPHPGGDWLGELELEEPLRERLLSFREALQLWLWAADLPVDQLVLTLAQELFRESADLALAYKLALVLRHHAAQHPDKRLPDLVEELAVIARNERRFLGFDDADLGYQPKPGTITVSTMHKAKGLEWDRVYLVGVNNYNFPSAEPHDFFRGESWFIQDELNLEAEAIAQLERLNDRRLDQYIVGEATEKARIDYAAERLRLLYVGITRAKKELVITWNTGHPSFGKKTPAAPFIALQTYWEQHLQRPPSENGSSSAAPREVRQV